MKKSRKIFLFAVVAIISAFLVKEILDFPYLTKIPQLPELEKLSLPLQKQIKTASLKAKMISTAKNIGELGMVYQSMADYDRASVCYKLAINKDDSNWIWNYYLGYINKEMGESANSIENFQNVIRKNPKVFHAWYYLGEAHRNIGENDKAIVAYEKITPWLLKEPGANTSSRLDFFSLNTYTKCQIASLFINTKQIDQAENSLNEMIDGNKSFGWAYRLLGRVYTIKGDTVRSNKSVVRANDLISYTIPVDTLIDKISIMSRSEMYLLKQIDEADKGRYFDWELQLLKQGLKYLPDNKYLTSKVVTFHLKNNTAKQALPFLKNHFEAFRDDFNELSYVANLLFEKRYFAQSNLYFIRCLDLRPEETDLQVFLILGVFNQNEKQKAISLMEDYVKKDSLNPKIIANAVVELIDMEELEMAAYYLNKLKIISPSSAKTFFFSGKMAQLKGDIQKAQAFYEVAYNKNPEDIIGMKALCDVLMRQKLWEQAIIHFKKSMNYFPNEPYLLEIYGTLLVVCPDSKLRNYNQGMEYLERAFYHKDCPPEIAISAGKSLAEAHEHLGNNQIASAYLNLVINFAKSLDVAPEYLEKLEQQLKELN